MRDEEEIAVVSTEPTTLAKRDCDGSERSFVSSFIPHPSSLRILLWDIDGTLIRTARAGAFKDYTIPMLQEVFGTAGRLPEMKVSDSALTYSKAFAVSGELMMTLSSLSTR